MNEPQYILTVCNSDGTRCDTSFGTKDVMEWHATQLNNCAYRIGARIRFAVRQAESEPSAHLIEKRIKSFLSR